MTDHELTIREMCDAFDVTPRTLRFYEAKELLCPGTRGTETAVHAPGSRTPETHPQAARASASASKIFASFSTSTDPDQGSRRK
jgi:hypothetical protein